MILLVGYNNIVIIFVIVCYNPYLKLPTEESGLRTKTKLARLQFQTISTPQTQNGGTSGAQIQKISFL